MLTTGKEDGQNGDLGLSNRGVVDLCSDHHLLHKGYRVYTDNFYTSPDLYLHLRDLGFKACGTVRLNRRGIPVEVRQAKLKKGEIASFHDDMLLTLKWKDKRDVTLLSTFHDDSMISKRL